MDKYHQDKIGSKLKATEDELWLPPLPPKDQKKVDHLQKKPFAERMGFAGKTPWDLIQLLLIPLVLAGVGYWFTSTQAQISLQSSQKQHDTDLQIAATRYVNDQKLAGDQQRATTLETYIARIQDLLLNYKLRESKPSDEVRVLARAQTLSALSRLDPGRKGTLLQFLYEAHLIDPKNTIISLRAADLTRIDLDIAKLSNINLSGANLEEAFLFMTNLVNADLSGVSFLDALLSDANLSGANLRGVHFEGAFLIGADLSGDDLSNDHLSNANLITAKLSRANLEGANLWDAKLSGANLEGARLSRASLHHAQLGSFSGLASFSWRNYGDWPVNFSESGAHFSDAADLIKADLSSADLIEANLNHVNLDHANLSGADLSHADLSDANLSGADLSHAIVTQEQLIQAKSLKGAIMPDGSKHP